MTRMTRLREASDECMAGRPILRRTCAQPVKIRVIPENEIPPAMRVDVYLVENKSLLNVFDSRYDNGVKSADEIGYSFGRDGHAAFKPVRHDGNGTVAAV